MLGLLKENNIYASTWEQVKGDTVNISIPIKYIKEANIKLTERLYLKDLVIAKDSTISLKDSYIKEQKIIIKDFQDKLSMANDLNLNLNKTNKKLINRNKVWKITTILLGTTVGILILTR